MDNKDNLKKIYVSDSSYDYVDKICDLYGSPYDDRIVGEHKSLRSFQKELKENGISLSTSKIQKILITGGYWSTERSREIYGVYSKYAKVGTDKSWALRKTAEELSISIAMADMCLPYEKAVYGLENKSMNAIKCARYKLNKRNK